MSIPGIGQTSCVLAQRPGMGVMPSSYWETRYRPSTGPLFGPHDVLNEAVRTRMYLCIDGVTC